MMNFQTLGYLYGLYDITTSLPKYPLRSFVNFNRIQDPNNISKAYNKITRHMKTQLTKAEQKGKKIAHNTQQLHTYTHPSPKPNTYLESASSPLMAKLINSYNPSPHPPRTHLQNSQTIPHPRSSFYSLQPSLMFKTPFTVL